MNKDHVDALWHEAELASVNSDLEIHQIFYKLIADNIRADEREACAKLAEKELHNITVLTSMPLQSSAAWTILQKIKARGEVK